MMARKPYSSQEALRISTLFPVERRHRAPLSILSEVVAGRR
jgi:hypothetical protein